MFKGEKSMDYEYEINLVELIKHVLKKWRLILISIITFSLLFAGYAYFKTETYYKSEAIVEVLKEDTKNPVQKLGVFDREDIIEKCVLCKTEDNGIVHVTNNYIKFKKIRDNKLDANT